jgi:flavorubredoxin
MAKKITDQIYWVGINDHESELFEELWPLPHGISYNAYLICDEKIALIDTVKKNFFEEFAAGIRPLLQKDQKVDYLVINHIEPDHSGALESLLRLYPDLCVIGNEKTLHLLHEFYRFPVKTRLVQDRETLSLGQHTLEFFITPMVHWPETMMTYEQRSKILFSGDVFGSFGELSAGIFDDEVDRDLFMTEARRYFANVLGKYGTPLQKSFLKIEKLDIKVIASTHGPVYRKDPARIQDLYARWSRHGTEEGVVIVYASMYENTKRMAETIARGLAENGVKEIRLFNVSHTHLSFILGDVWQFRGLILASCTYNTKLFPLMGLLVNFLENEHIEKHLLGILGSYSWANNAIAALRSFAQKGSWQLVEPVIEAQSAPSEEVLAKCIELGKNMALQLHNVPRP